MLLAKEHMCSSQYQHKNMFLFDWTSTHWNLVTLSLREASLARSKPLEF
jgi:hypothetical protein